MDIRIDDLSGPEVKQILTEHLKDMFTASPPECVFALDLDGLKKPNITFWTVWEDRQLLGCGALKILDKTHGEIKSMRTTGAARNKGVASTLLRHILDTAKQRGLNTISLETGSQDFFAPARKLYAKHDFTECGPFSDYKLDPHSVFMSREL
ncbi:MULTISPECIES: GNAT family N-acetyltransferase [Marinomonas]|uniref:GNAT family N-acetyltransferase n=1 Tax=Marinomonas arctica TaxID=383750 RepID=A0A7H1J8L2_9GAMM|nr:MULTISPECIES: GNAT family N-acetyltransferase [Marinomonas]MCS7487583.1 GCN5 family acetyltransferase [Marinomonas sp. BSi20414]QNT06828.1 GNAT family N-acetyltransferase [Marinomonas arctica]GGN23742.1 N-acetyltransferase [Marinomonas arctica]